MNRFYSAPQQAVTHSSLDTAANNNLKCKDNLWAGAGPLFAIVLMTKTFRHLNNSQAFCKYNYGYVSWPFFLRPL